MSLLRRVTADDSIEKFLDVALVDGFLGESEQPIEISLGVLIKYFRWLFEVSSFSVDRTKLRTRDSPKVIEQLRQFLPSALDYGAYDMDEGNLDR